MRLVIKIGGTLLDALESRQRLAREMADLQRAGHAMVIVHGGGKQMTRFLSAQGIESRFVNGLRVTTPEVVDALLKVFAGTVNHELVSSLVEAGALAVGLSGIDAKLVEAEPLHPELGAVGKPVHSNPAVLVLLTANGFLPVVACVAGGADGRIFNVNADAMAVSCAAAFVTDQLIFLTDVDGVRGAEGNVIPSLRPADCAHLIQAGIATGGMQAKLSAATDAIRAGINQVVIAPGSLEGAAEDVVAGKQIGTRIVREEEKANA